jgi:hypothetical protein
VVIMTQASEAADAILRQHIQHLEHSSVLLDDTHSLNLGQVKKMQEVASKQGTASPLPEMHITGPNGTESSAQHYQQIHHSTKKLPIIADQRGVDTGAVAKEIASGVVDEVTHHTGRVALKVAEGLLEGAFIVAAAPLVAPELLVSVGVMGAGLAGYEIYKNAGEWYHDAKVVSHQTNYSSDEITEAKLKLHTFGQGATDFAAQFAGGGVALSSKTAAELIQKTIGSVLGKFLTGSTRGSVSAENLFLPKVMATGSNILGADYMNSATDNVDKKGDSDNPAHFVDIFPKRNAK